MKFQRIQELVNYELEYLAVCQFKSLVFVVCCLLLFVGIDAILVSDHFFFQRVLQTIFQTASQGLWMT